jgi:hypothetical protein
MSRTTVTLEPDTEALVRRAMKERGLSFKEAVNLGLREGLGARTETRPYRVPTRNMGVPKMDLTKALQLSGELEDAEFIRKMNEGR